MTCHPVALLELLSPCSAPATVASWLFLNCAGHVPASGPLHFPFFLSGVLLPDLPSASSFLTHQNLTSSGRPPLPPPSHSLATLPCLFISYQSEDILPVYLFME